jgi:hypothetical protein
MAAGRDDSQRHIVHASAKPTTSARKGFVMNTELVQLFSPRPPLRQAARTDLVTCSLCLRVLRDSEWVDAERTIREIRSFDLESLPRMQPAVCNVCAGSIFRRRSQVGGLSAA